MTGNVERQRPAVVEIGNSHSGLVSGFTAQMRPIDMKPLVFAAIGALSLSVYPVIAEDVIKRTYWLDVAVAADGTVSAATMREQAPAAITDFVENRVRGWRFRTGEVNGEPAPTDTSVRVKFEAHPKPDDPNAFDLRVASASAGVRTDSKPVVYPREVLRRGAQGLVILAVDIDGDGTVLDVRPFENAPGVDRRLQAAVMDSVRSEWTFVPERVAGQGVPATVVVNHCLSSMRVADGRRPPREPPASSLCDFSLVDYAGDAADPGTGTLQPVARLLSDPAEG